MRRCSLVLPFALLLAAACVGEPLPPPAGPEGGMDGGVPDVVVAVMDAPPEAAEAAAVPEVWPPVPVYLAPTWEPPTRATLLRELLRLHALGPAFVPAAAPGPGVVEVHPFRGDCFEDVAHVRPGTRVVELDPSCMSGEEALQQAAGHTIGHALGLGHICTEPGELPGCSPVGYGLALMGARLRPSASGRGEVYSGARGTADTTDLDRAELLRVYSRAFPLPDGGSR